MTTEAAARDNAPHRFERLRLAREILTAEGRALLALADRLDGRAFSAAVELLRACRGSVIVSGMGKAGLIGQKIAATLASTGTPSHFVHPSEALHGDLGRVQPEDVALLLSYSGHTEEVVELAGHLADMEVPQVAVTGRLSSPLARAARVALDLGPLQEAGTLGLAPTTSTTCMLAVGDALALVVSRAKGFRREDFARRHPGGSLGRQLGRVDDRMRPLDQCRVALEELTVREVYVRLSRPGRRTGAIMLTDARGRLQGVFTDSDLARLLESNRDAELDGPIGGVMTRAPKTVPLGSRLLDAVELMADNRISELPVVDGQGAPVGLLDITDLVGLEPSPAESSADASGPWSAPPVVPFPGTSAGSGTPEARSGTN